jgi:serine/threonine protein kinase
VSFNKQQPALGQFRERVREDPANVVAIVGAGLSRPAGLPNWAELRRVLLDDARQQVESEKTGVVSDAKREAIARIDQSTDFWKDFTAIRNLLGRTLFETIVTQHLTLKPGNSIPAPYTLLWRLGIKGIVTFNLDSCAEDAFSEVHRRAINHAAGKEVGRYDRFLQLLDPFVFHPHGILGAPETWAFTEADLEDVFAKPEYSKFFSSLFDSRTILIAGFNPQDAAFKQVLARSLGALRSGKPIHYCLLADPTPEDCAWLDQRGFIPIRYTPSDENHPEVAQILQGVLAYIPRDAFVPSVYAGDRIEPAKLPSDGELARRDVQECREMLNGAVAEILSNSATPEEKRDDELWAFLRGHRQSVSRAWLVDDYAPYNDFFEFEVDKRIGKGAFGNVFMARAKNSNEEYAIKMLLDECIRNREYLACFRRGARAMQILTDRNVQGMVRFHKAYEVPACIVMEHVAGKDLDVAVREGGLAELSTCLNVLVKVAEIVDRGHRLDERVLHRDLKPTNVRLRDYVHAQPDPDVVVLDFDLSWYHGASGLSVVEGARMAGYAAPEQTRPIEELRRSGVTTRHTAVDVFGLGMLAFFTFTGRDPHANEQEFTDFRSTLRCGVEKHMSRAESWRTLPEELADLIVQCTREKQSERPGFDDVLERLRTYRDMALNSSMPSGDTMLLKEIAYRIGTTCDGLSHEDFGRKVVSRMPMRTYSLSLSTWEGKPAVHFRIDRDTTEADLRKHVGEFLKTKAEKAASLLRTHHGRDARYEPGKAGSSVYATFEIGELTPARAEQMAGVFISALNEMEKF